MSDILEKLQIELQAAEHELSESKARVVHMEAEHQATATKLANIHKQIEQAHQEWMASLDVISDPIFLLDKDFRILRCNRAYQRYAGIPFKQIIGQPYYEIFPKTRAAALPNFPQDPEKAEIDSEIVVGDTTFRSRAYVVTDEQDSFLYSIHILENINEHLRSQRQLRESEEQYRRLFESAKDGILILDAETGKIIDANPFILNLLSYSFDELAGKVLWETGLLADIEANKRASEELLSEEYIRYEDLSLMSKDGRRVQVEFVSNIYAAGERKVIQCNIRDITESLHAKELLVASHDLLKSVIENTPARVFWKDIDLHYLGCNSAFAYGAGMSCPEDLIGKDDFQLGWKEQAGLYRADDRQVMDSGMPKLGYEERQTTPDGRVIWISTSKVPLRAANGDIVGILGIYEDITEQKQAEVELRDSEHAYRTLTQNLPGLAYRVFVRENSRMAFFNDKLVQITGYTEDELPAGAVCSIEPLILEEDRPGIEAEVKQAIAEKRPFSVEYRLQHKNGSILWMAEYGMPIYGPDDAPLYLDGVIYDITKGRRAEQALRQAEEKFRALVETTSDWIWEMDSQGRYSYASPRVEALLGYRPQEMLGKTPFDFMPPQEARRVGKAFEKFAEQRVPIPALENTSIHKDGSLRVLETNGVPFFDENGKFSGYRGIDRDITERKKADETLKRTNRALKTLSASNLALVRASSEDELLKQVTNAIVLHSDYQLATVCYAVDELQKSIMPMAWSGTEDNYYLSTEISWANTEQGQLPIAEAIRNGKIQNCTDIASYLGYAPWKAAALAHGYASNIALPLNSNGKTFGGLSIYSSKPNAFDKEEVKLLEELANDLAYGIKALRTRKEHEQHEIILRKSLKQFIQAIADTVEARDLYTAGHQRRVAELATAIAQEMGLPEEQINAINLAAIIHDLGKIRIPAEILSKPAKLNEVEFMLIKTHPQAGYDILKNVEFPWPISDIILQHHEKMDGSGYPQGLEGTQILLESRILTVADVVEAMSSHRPYRAALGIESALNEIRRGRKVEYDAAVVDTCLKLFAEKEFRFSDS